MMRKQIVTLAAMFLTATGLWAQIDVHSHAITTSYMDFVKAHGAEMDEGFPIPGWNVEDHLAFMDQAGIETAHFRKYKEGTADMVQSLKLIDTIPLVMAEFVKKAQ